MDRRPRTVKDRGRLADGGGSALQDRRAAALQADGLPRRLLGAMAPQHRRRRTAQRDLRLGVPEVEDRRHDRYKLKVYYQ